MNGTLWILLLVALTGAGGRLAKLYPKVPKKLMPALVLALGAGLYVLKARLVDGLPVADALMSWQVILTGASAIAGHDLLKGAAQCMGMDERVITKLLGSLPKPAPATPPPSDDEEPGISAGGATSVLWIWTAVCWFGIGVTAVVTPGCGGSVQARVADAMAKSVKKAKAELLVEYEKEGDTAITKAAAQLGDDPTDEERAAARAESDAQLAVVKEKWKPVWDAIKAFAVVHDQWATAIETGGAVDLEGVLAAFCKLVGLAKPWLELPDIPGVVCPEVSP
jgi:hypothetical protein